MFKLTKDFALQMVRQNPSLEYLIGVYEGFGNMDLINEEMKKLSPRFRDAVFKVVYCYYQVPEFKYID
jgi:hypothetical protein